MIYLQVDRALTVWRDKCISCETVAAVKAKKRSSAIIKTVNATTGKESTITTDFTQLNWALTAKNYFVSVKNAYASNPMKFNLIIDDAKSFVKATSRTVDTTFNNTLAGEQDLDERAFLCDDDSD